MGFLEWVLFVMFMSWRVIVDAADSVKHRITGASEHRGQAAVYRILLRQRQLIHLASNIVNFVKVHETNHPLEYLQRVDVSLYTIEGEYVYFIQTSFYAELTDTRKHPFFFVAQNLLAERLIKVHQDDLVEFVESLPKPKAKVMWIHHSARCGSTAMAQAINAIGDWTVLSEISWLVRAIPHELETYDEIKAYMTGDRFSRIARSCIISQLIHYDEDTKVCWKTNSVLEPYLLPLVTREFPEHKIVYLVRRGDKTTFSLYRVVRNSTLIPFYINICFNYTSFTVLKLFGIDNDLYANSNGILTPCTRDFWFDGLLSTYQYFYCLWVTNVALLRDMRRFQPAIRLMLIDYDVYMRDLRANLKQVFDYAGISDVGIQKAVDAYKMKSQVNSVMHKEEESLSEWENWKIDEISLRKCNKLARDLGLKSHDETLTKDYFEAGADWKYIID